MKRPVDIDKNKKCRSCKIKEVLSEVDGFTAVFCPSTCPLQKKDPVVVKKETKEEKEPLVKIVK